MKEEKERVINFRLIKQWEPTNPQLISLGVILLCRIPQQVLNLIIEVVNELPSAGIAQLGERQTEVTNFGSYDI